MGARSTGAEVGVREGHFSDLLLTHSRCASLYSIDPWREFSHNDYLDISNRPQEQQEAIFKECSQRLSRHGNRSHIVRGCSVEVACGSEVPSRLDFVYLDAQHHYEAVMEDLRAWHGKMRPGGLMMGHDYVDGDYPAGKFGVRRAVDEFFGRLGRQVFSTVERDWPSWFVQL